jgi:hypothetical protein
MNNIKSSFRKKRKVRRNQLLAKLKRDNVKNQIENCSNLCGDERDQSDDSVNEESDEEDDEEEKYQG